MLTLLILVALLTATWFLLLVPSRGLNRALQRKLILPFSGSLGIWLLWFAIRKYSPPVTIGECWSSVSIGLVAFTLSVLASLRMLRTQLRARVALAMLSLSVALLSFVGAVLSVPVS